LPTSSEINRLTLLASAQLAAKFFKQRRHREPERVLPTTGDKPHFEGCGFTGVPTLEM
jgi:hypothetical protein